MKLKRVCYLLSGCLLVLCAFACSVSAQTLCPFPPDTHPINNVWPTVPLDPVIDNGDGTCSYAPDPVVDSAFYSCAPDGQLPPPPDFPCEPVNTTVARVTPLTPAQQSSSTSGGCTSTPSTNTVQAVKSQTPAAPVTVKPTVTAPPPKCTVTSVPSTTPTQKTYSVTTNAAPVKPASKSTAAPSVVTQPSQPKNCDEVTSIDMMF